MEFDSSRFITVRQITEYVRDLLESDPVLEDLWLAGEVSNFTRAASGHVYMTLKDADAQIRCVMWRSYASRQAYLPREGDQILAHGRVSVYVAGGAYQFYVDAMQPLGIGQLYLEFEALKERLAEEGLFAPEHKRPLPPFPECIGVVTSPTGAAFRDILNVLGRRYPLSRVLLSPSLVQGFEAPPQIVAALEALYQRDDVEVIVLARGGGSLEDLWAFNDERVARAIFAAPVPVISGVGHETDYTIADFVADMRAPTPSAAAELVAPDRDMLLGQVRAQELRLTQLARQACSGCRADLEDLAQTLVYLSPERLLAQYRQELDDHVQRLTVLVRHRTALLREQLKGQQMQLQSLSPLRSLERGYAIVRRTADGDIVQRVEQVQEGESLSVQVSDGAFVVRVGE